MEQYETIIIGGGASGLIAGISAARHGKNPKNILIIEKNPTLGRKITVTGNGRCNLTNTNITLDKYYGENTKCLNNIFGRFSHKDTVEFFESIGIILKTEDKGRVFPITNQAITVLDLLLEEITHFKINIKTTERVNEIIPTNQTDQIGIPNRPLEADSRVSYQKDWKVITSKDTYRSKYIILTTGGKSYPQLGSSGEGLEFARKLGHRIVEPKPALVPIELSGNWFHKLQGVKSDVELTLTSKNKVIAMEKGELLFTHYGISGPIVMDMSRLITDSLPKPETKVFINFFPDFTVDKLTQFFISRGQAYPQKTFLNSLFGVLPKKLCYVLMRELGVTEDKHIHQLSKKELCAIADRLIHWYIDIKQTRPFAESMVTAGGIAMDEVNSRTMESLKVKGLYFAGEILDIDGVSGGYNLQFAWSTGYIAGLLS
ncbi:MAG: NAD(P)/FAD-dependent oxidoreductase [bacterium]|nr:NAD(P)/FAD-dependent oxidoreductase [bacterium]